MSPAVADPCPSSTLFAFKRARREHAEHDCGYSHERRTNAGAKEARQSEYDCIVRSFLSSFDSLMVVDLPAQSCPSAACVFGGDHRSGRFREQGSHARSAVRAIRDSKAQRHAALVTVFL